MGTTNSCIATIDPISKLPIVIKNAEELSTTPSVVFYDNLGTPIVGGDAKRSMKQDPSRAVAFIKREISNPNYRRTIDGQEISPVSISAMILKKLVSDANLSRKFQKMSEIRDVVITVPAYFGAPEHELTKQAGEVAGLNVLALINEPTAAALCYGKRRLIDKTFMIYDLGGGTFDVSIMRMQNGDLETLSTDGNHYLGGLDWDIELVNYVLSRYCKTEDRYEDIKDKFDGGAMILAAENCKKLLSNNDQAQMRFRYNQKLYEPMISRSKFEEITLQLLDKTINVVKNAISISIDKNAKIDEIILVGGSSYMPMVRKRLNKEYPGIPICLEQFEPDLAVAKGAAIHAYNLANPCNNTTGSVKIKKDLASRSYGVLVLTWDTDEEKIQNLILRTDSMECSKSDTTCTREEGQKNVRIQIYENNSIDRFVDLSVTNGVKKIAEQVIEWGYPVPKHTVINYKIKRNSDAIVHIDVECQNKTIKFEIKPDQVLSDDEIKRLKKEIGGMQF